MENREEIRTGVLRGSGWYVSGRGPRAASRVHSLPVERDDCLGFRLVLVREKTNGE